jgi:hypothetical protein
MEKCGHGKMPMREKLAHDDEACSDVRGEIGLMGENVYKEAGVFGTFL